MWIFKKEGIVIQVSAVIKWYNQQCIRLKLLIYGSQIVNNYEFFFDIYDWTDDVYKVDKSFR